MTDPGWPSKMIYTLSGSGSGCLKVKEFSLFFFGAARYKLYTSHIAIHHKHQLHLKVFESLTQFTQFTLASRSQGCQAQQQLETIQ
jgi:hypothetical protein